MGRRLFQEVYASQDRTDALGLPDLMVVSEADDPETADSIYHAVHKTYFSKDKQICPYCQGANTAETKIRSRKFKDILPSANGNRKVIDLVFHQRYFRCDDCNRIFSENIDFATYVWLITKEKPVGHREHVQLIDASKCFVPRRKPIGNKRVDITQEARDLIVKAYGEYRDDTFESVAEGGHKLLVKSKILSSLSLGYNKITVETPITDEDGNPIFKKGKMQADSSKRDTENVPLDEDMDEYFKREVLPYSPNAWIDHSKDKVGYEIPFTRTFYEYEMLEPAEDIAIRIEEHERVLMNRLQALFGKAGL